jgi:hemolysin III
MDEAVSSAALRVKPRYRGVPHSIGALIAIPAAVLLVRHASTPMATHAAIVYGLSLVFLLSASAVYHKPTWSPEKRLFLRRVDHLAIFVLIAGSYTPLSLMGLPHDDARTLLTWCWSFAGVGALVSLFWPTVPRWINVGLNITMGWMILPYASQIGDTLAPLDLVLIFGGGALYSFGAITYARRSPDPYPEVFGYHEIFHTLVLIAVGCHYAAIWRVLG